VRPLAFFQDPREGTEKEIRELLVVDLETPECEVALFVREGGLARTRLSLAAFLQDLVPPGATLSRPERKAPTRRRTLSSSAKAGRLVNSARVLSFRGQYAESLALLEEAAALDPERERIHLEIGIVARTAGALELPQLSYSIALGRSDGAIMAHMWGGAGAHVERGPNRVVFVLGGVEVDFRESVIEPAGPNGVSRESSGFEGWAALRIGVGWFNRRALAPRASAYTIVGYRFAGPAGKPTVRLGVGTSVPAALPIAWIGIPTMIELGADAGGEESLLRGFFRLGWNF
jgi:hypothetical protein